MKLTITNNQNHAVPIMSTDGEGFVESLEPSQPYELDNEIQVLIIGNKPSVTEQIETAFKRLGATAKALITAWQGRNNQVSTADGNVACTIENKGEEKAVRVILGDGVTDHNVAPGERYEATAWGYLELRELGNVQQDPNQHEAA